MTKKALVLRVTGAVFLTAFFGCTSAQVHPGTSGNRTTASEDTTFHIVSTTDLHGYLLAQKNNNGTSYGGVDWMEGYFKIAKAADPETLFLDSGDLFQGTLVSNDFKGAPVVKFYNYVGYDYTAIGNHDFDYGPRAKNTVVPLNPHQDPQGALKARERQAHFRFLSANICSVKEDKHQCTDLQHWKPASFTHPYAIREVHGVKVGIIGLTTATTPDVTIAANVTELRFMDPAVALDRYVAKLKSRGVQAILVIAHIGGFCDQGPKHDTCNPQDELFQMIDHLSPETRASIPLILAGHTHNYENLVYNGVHVMITGKYGQSFGYETLTYHGDTGTLTLDEAKSIDFCQQVYQDTGYCSKGSGPLVAPTFLGQEVTPDPGANQVIAKAVAVADAQSAAIVGKLDSPLVKGQPESTAGDFITDAMRFCWGDSSCQQNADASIMNNGGIRSEITQLGEVTYGQVFQMMPFDNVVATMQISGAQFRGVLDSLYKESGMPQVSGLKIEFDTGSGQSRSFTNDAGQSETLDDPIKSITFSDGSALDESKTYTVILPDFLATGGGTEFFTKTLKNAPVLNYNRKMRDAMVDFLKSKTDGLSYTGQSPRLINDSSTPPTY